jgi:putative oxidoreductase
MSLCSWKVSCSEAALSLLIQLPTQTRERSNYSALPSMKFLTADNLHELSDYLTVPLRLALALSFLFPVADRLGMLGPPGTPEVTWGNFTNFLAYNAQVNSFLPVAIRPTLGLTATVFEILFGVTLFLGVYTRLFAAGAGILLLLFGSAMAISLGIKSPFDYSVFSAMGGALLLAAWDVYPLSVDTLFRPLSIVGRGSQARPASYARRGRSYSEEGT